MDKVKKAPIPPQDNDAERAFLGALMLKSDSLNDVLDQIHPEDFYAEKHRLIYNAILSLFEKGDPVDAISVTSHLKENKQIDRIGGASTVAELINTAGTSANLSHYAKIIRKKSALRNLITSADDIMGLGYKEEHEVDSLIDEAEKIIFGIRKFSRKTFTSLKDALPIAFERFDKLHKSGDEVRGVPTGFRDLDNLLAGLQKSDLIILAARPSMGKTSLALDIARNAALHSKVSVGIFSLEMSSQQLVERMLASESRVDSWRLRTGKLSTDDEFSKLRDALDELSKAPIYIDDEPGNNIIKMKAVARRMKTDHNIGLIIVDYLQLMTTTKNFDSMVNQVTEISRSLKGLARELDIPVLALSQLSRAVESRGGKPRLSDLRDSGSIEQDADVVMFIHRDDKYNEASEKKGIAEILIEKHRNGPTGKADLFFDEKRVSFSSVEKTDFGEF